MVRKKINIYFPVPSIPKSNDSDFFVCRKCLLKKDIHERNNSFYMEALCDACHEKWSELVLNTAKNFVPPNDEYIYAVIIQIKKEDLPFTPIRINKHE